MSEEFERSIEKLDRLNKTWKDVEELMVTIGTATIIRREDGSVGVRLNHSNVLLASDLAEIQKRFKKIA